jgi:uncharacterized protein HemX
MTSHLRARLTLAAAALAVTAPAAAAYVGPGAGVTAIGTLLALVAAAALTVAGFVWYPVKRVLARRRREAIEPPAPRATGPGRDG